ncbi:MAG TPA: hypothetical protein VNP73_04805 [Actinomycetota bacterium]|nr:hypothetical protein [Actinomycetota bacterium]
MTVPLDLAGPVFEGWYWGVFFLAIFVGAIALFAGVVTAIVAAIARARGKPLGRTKAIVLLVCLTLVLSSGILIWRRLSSEMEFDQTNRRAAAAFDFEPYLPADLPSGWSSSRRQAISTDGGELWVTYEHPEGYIFTGQHSSIPGFRFDPPEHCSIGVRGLSSGSFDGPCRRLTTPRGLDVYVGGDAHTAGDTMAIAVLQNTTVRLAYFETYVADEDLVLYFDSLRPVDPLSIDYFDRG